MRENERDEREKRALDRELIRLENDEMKADAALDRELLRLENEMKAEECARKKVRE